MTSWNEFEKNLATALRSVTDRVYLIVWSVADKTRYIQFAAVGDRLDAEAPGVGIVSNAREEELRDAGWRAPAARGSLWQSPLRVPALTTEYRELAERCVIALRDAYGIASPNDLTYTSWREADVPPLHSHPSETQLTEAARGDLDLQIPALNLSRAASPQPGR